LKKSFLFGLVLLITLNTALFAKGSYARLDRIVIKELSSYWSMSDHFVGGEPSNQKVYSKVIDHYKDPTDKNNLIIVTSSYTKEGNDCHDCGASISFFFFKRKSHKYRWKKEKSYIDALLLGDYGVAPKKDELKINSLGGGKLGLFYKTHSLAQGYEGDFLDVFDISTSEVKKIISLRLSMDNSAAMSDKIEKWSSTYHFDSESNLIQEIKGTLDKKPFKKTKTFSFDGDSYKEVK
jgi:hypothetical protein